MPYQHGALASVLGWVLAIFEIMSTLELLLTYANFSNVKTNPAPKLNVKKLFDVDIFITTYNEPLEIVAKTIEGVLNLEYPQKSKIHIFLCDDGNRADFKAFATKKGINYLSRTTNEGAKAGNLNAALKKSKSPLIVTFDADMIPSPDFLISTVPYFQQNPSLGFLQTPQTFYQHDIFQLSAPKSSSLPPEHDYFYRKVQLTKNKSNSVIYCGTNAVVSRQAIQDVGGFYQKSLTEDFGTGVEIEAKGYTCMAISKILAKGLPPTDLNNLFSQRKRWCRGNLQCGIQMNLLFKKGLTVWQKLNYISSILNWYFPLKQFVFLLAPIIFAVFGVPFATCTLASILIFWLPMYLLTTYSTWFFSSGMRQNKWTRIYETVFAPVLFFPCLAETFGFKQKNFHVTSKSKTRAHLTLNYAISLKLTYFLLIALCLFGAYNIIITVTLGFFANLFVLLWLLLNLYYLSVALKIIYKGAKKA
ncbi:MAG: glycosyltransferase [Clostridiales bacterium]|jgi:cellulose synthase (UDP-forming)|nr:glycosyltransferase [Clostridiales bacterium]